MEARAAVDRDVPAGRALHLIDLENLLDGHHETADAAEVAWAVSGFCRHADWHRDDLVVVAANPALLGRIAFDLPTGWQKVAAPGPDGADRALLRWAGPDLLRHRFHRLVLGSGDGIFSGLAEAVRALGGEVWVVASGGHLSRRLAACATTVVLLDALVPPVGVEAGGAPPTSPPPRRCRRSAPRPVGPPSDATRVPAPA